MAAVVWPIRDSNSPNASKACLHTQPTGKERKEGRKEGWVEGRRDTHSGRQGQPLTQDYPWTPVQPNCSVSSPRTSATVSII